MRFRDGGYIGAQFDPKALRETVNRLSRAIPYYMDALKADAIAVTGKSGISVAFAALMEVNFPLIVVRKRGETTHGSPIEGSGDVDVRRYLVLDDFVSSGNTVVEIVSRLDEYADLQGGHIDCAGVIEYGFSMYETRRTVPTKRDKYGYGCAEVRRYGIRDFDLSNLTEGAKPDNVRQDIADYYYSIRAPRSRHPVISKPSKEYYEQVS